MTDKEIRAKVSNLGLWEELSFNYNYNGYYIHIQRVRSICMDGSHRESYRVTRRNIYGEEASSIDRVDDVMKFIKKGFSK